MSLGLILLAATLTGVTVAYVISPLLWQEPAADAASDATELYDLRAALRRAYAALREIESDHSLGKTEPAAYASARAGLETEAAGLLQRIDALGSTRSDGEVAPRSKVARRKLEAKR
ncbi:MAG TPA: hypothetical protein VFN74_22815 [Chloroflexota bacterium]|nr:hypothetical protein [Chloroflexota bacterium]